MGYLYSSHSLYYLLLWEFEGTLQRQYITFSPTIWRNEYTAFTSLMNYLTHQLNIKCLRTISLWILYLQQLTVFWNVVPCSLIVVHWSHGGMCCHHCQGVWVYFFEPSGCGSRFVWNSVELLPEYMTSHLKRQ